MPSYTTLTTEWLAQTIIAVQQHPHLAQQYASLSPFEDFANKLLLAGLELILTDPKYTSQLSRAEKENALQLKDKLVSGVSTFSGLQQEITLILASARRGWWIFDIGFSNGLFYEAMIILLRYIQSQQVVYLQEHQSHLLRLKETLEKRTDNSSAEMYQRTIKLKQSLADLNEPDTFNIKSPDLDSASKDKSPAILSSINPR